MGIQTLSRLRPSAKTDSLEVKLASISENSDTRIGFFGEQQLIVAAIKNPSRNISVVYI
jgi:hypothetical protein